MRSLINIVALITILSPSISNAGLIYTVDVDADELLRVNDVTGDVETIGSLGRSVESMKLTRIGDRLFGLNTGLGPELFEIDHQTGSILSAESLTYSGGLGRVESFGHVGNQLKVGFNTNGGTVSNLLGDLAVDGTVSNAIAFGNTPAGNGTDFDTLGAGTGTKMYASDSNFPFGNTSDDTIYFALDTDTNNRVEVARFSDTGYFPNDIVLNGSELLNMGQTSAGSLIRGIDVDTGSVRDQMLSRSGNFQGIASAASVPEPSSACLVLMFGNFFMSRRGRRDTIA